MRSRTASSALTYKREPRTVGHCSTVQKEVLNTVLFRVIAKTLSFSLPRRRSTLLLAAVLAALAGPGLAAPPERTMVNINRADAETIARNIKGIGLKRAEEIVAYREANGPFRDAYDLTAIKGIGERIVANNESRIQVHDR